MFNANRNTLAAIILLSLGAIAYANAASKPESLVDLVRAGNREAVLAAITSPEVNVNAEASDGSTALLWATYAVDHDLVRALLKAGAKANVINHYGSSPLSEAVKLDDIELVRPLLDAGANPNTPNQDNQTPLMLASSLGSLEIAKLLISREANVNTVETFRGQTALMWAAANNHAEVVDLLIAHGAEVKPRAKSDDWERQMTSEPRAQFRNTGGLTALLYATRASCYRCAVAIVNAGADINQPNPDGITPLINALDNRAFDIAMFLIDKGAKVDTWDMNGRTPLYIAVDMNSFRAAGGFGGGGGAGVSFSSVGGSALGTQAATRGQSTVKAMDVVNRLISMGVDINHELTRMRPNGPGRGRFADYNLRGGTGPLMVAAMSYDDEAIKVLLKSGAEVDLPNVFEITPLMAVANMSGTGRGNGAVPGGGDPQVRVMKTLDLLLDAGANINARITNSRTHTAKLVAYVAGRDNEGKTALFSAAEAGWDKVVKHMIERGADPTIKDAAGLTALDYARTPPGGPASATAPASGRGPTVLGGAADRAATVALLESLTPTSKPAPAKTP